MTIKIVVNRCYGGFSVSSECIGHMLSAGMLPYADECYYDINRDSKYLVNAVETLGSKLASGQGAKLEIVEIPDGTNWAIDEYDGKETVGEIRNTW